MKNKELLKKIGIAVVGVLLVCGVAIFIFKDNAVTETPTEEMAISTELIAEEDAIAGGLIPNEEKFQEVDIESETVEEIVVEETTEQETVVEETTEEETIVEESDHLEGITIKDKDSTESTDNDFENVDKEVGTEKEVSEETTIQNATESNVDNNTEPSTGNTESSTDEGAANTEQGSVHNTSDSANNQGSGTITSNTQTAPPVSSENQMQALFGNAYQGSGVGLTTDCGGSGNVE